MQTPHLTKVRIQDTPIKTLRIEWREGDTDHAVEIPLSWAVKKLIGSCYDSDFCGPAVPAVLSSINGQTPYWIDMIKEEWPEHIASLTCSDYEYPEIFAA